MEGLTQLSTSIFQSTQQFANPSPNRRLIAFEIAVIDRVGHFRRTEVAETDLEHWGSTDAVQPSGTSWPPTSTFEASFKLVCIERSLIISLNVSKDGFYRLLDVMEADPAVFYPICQDYDGFHEFPGGSCHRPTWFFGTSIHAILWTFDQTVKPARTVAIYFRRRRQSFNAFANFGEALRAFCNHAAAWQMTLLVIIVHSIHWFDETTLTNLNQIRRIEGCTGFGPQTLIPPYRARRDARTGKESYFSANNFDIDTLMEFSQGVNEVAGNLSNKLRHLRVLQTMLERLKIDAAQELTPSSPITNCFCPSAVESRRNLNTAVPAIMVRLTTQAEYLAYLRDRSERLSAVLFALLTHQDAAAAIDLGIANKRDTSSMKTIAIVTMTFLPATFLAALFAMPSLDWKGEKVISPRFWVYWAYTIPMTMLVFGVWLCITERQRLIRWLKMLRRPSLPKTN